MGIGQGTVQMIQSDLIAFYAAKILMIHLTALKGFALNVIE